MRRILCLLFLFSQMGGVTVFAGDSAVLTRTFYVAGVECGACVYLVQVAASECKGVLKADVVQTVDNYANVTFDPRLISEHQIAQAIRDAMPLHGTPYLARLKLRVGEYSKHAAALDALFQKWRDWVRWEVLDAAKGEMGVHFLPLQTAPAGTGPGGWSTQQFQSALTAALPTGVSVQFIEEKP